METDFPETPNIQKKKLCDNGCNSCGKLFRNDFLFALDDSNQDCDLRKVLSPYLEEFARTVDTRSREAVKFIRVGSSLATASTEAPTLSIVVGPGYSNAPSHIQRGFPHLAKSRSDTQFGLFKHWLRDCDKKHGDNCKGPDIPMRRPKRLIDVRNDSLKLDCEPDGRKDNCYIALSHPWGDNKKKHPGFCTTQSNIHNLKGSIDYDALPKNFQDAVTVTRKLNVDYLWIDSLCIIQDENGDFDTESKHMEAYYSGAYCTIAATSATGSSDGFLTERPTTGNEARNCSMFQSSNPESTFYICKSIDDFTRDVETSNLSKRGWVFQERALSRRTIHFTKTQAYWECGHGVRSETMCRLFNRRSSFLSDPRFPDSAKQYYKGMKIEFFQYIYSRYSALDFSYEPDRSVAMFGLERRLARAYEVRARYGIIDDRFLHRSLLWRAEATNKPLSKIKWEQNNDKAPSWSWMAVMGSIKYMDPPFGQTTWSKIESPFKEGPTEVNGVWTQPVSDFIVPARSVLQEVTPTDLIYDRPEYKDDESMNDKLKCVIIGWDEPQQELRGYYTLLVIPTGTSRGGCPDYERIGVACLTGDDFDHNDDNMINVRIV